MATVVVGTALAAAAGAATRSLDDLTLVKSDLPVGFSQTVSHRLGKSDVVTIQGSITTGYTGGWQRVFTRLQGVDTAAVTSSGLRYDSAANAHTAVRAAWKHTLAHTGAKRLTVGRPLGEEARAIAYQTKTGITAYAVIWRYKNIDGSILVLGLKSLGVTLDLATRLAVKQQRHISAARG